jgi:type I restriction enzyme, S subunit
MRNKLDARHDFIRKYGTPPGWRTVTLGELADVVGGGTPSRGESRFWQGGTILWATPTDLTANESKYLNRTAESITKVGLASSAATLLPTGSVLYTSRATIGAKAIATVPIATNQGFASFVPREVCGEFLYYLLDILTPIIKRLGSGTTFDEVSKRDIRNVFCAVPLDSDEQDAISRSLAAADTAIELARKAVNTSKDMRCALIQEFFYSALGVTAYADRPTKELPAGWSLRTTESLLVTDPKNGVSPKASSQPPGIPTFSIAAIRDGRLDLSTDANLKYAEVPAKVAEKFTLNIGDVLIVRGNANPDLVGKACMVKDFPEGCIYPDITKRVVFRTDGENIVTPEYAVLAWNHSVVHNQIMRRAKTSNGTLKINNRDVKQIIMPVPPTGMQKIIVDLVAAAEAKTDALICKLKALEQLKRSLMHDLLTGTVRVNPALFKETTPL